MAVACNGNQGTVKHARVRVSTRFPLRLISTRVLLTSSLRLFLRNDAAIVLYVKSAIAVMLFLVASEASSPSSCMAEHTTIKSSSITCGNGIVCMGYNELVSTNTHAVAVCDSALL